MKTSPFHVIFIAASWIVFLLAFAWPGVALVLQCVGADEAWPAEGVLSSRAAGLLWRSVWLAGAATAVSLTIGLAGALAMCGVRRPWGTPVLATLCVGWLLCPPTVYAFGWERVLPASFNPYVRCIGVWALWTWPIPALFVAAGWVRAGKQTFESALLQTSPLRAFLFAALPSLRGHVGCAAMIVFVLCFGDYGVPHACGLLVYPTELLGWSQETSQPATVVTASWPALGVTMVALVLTLVFFRSVTREWGTGQAELRFVAGRVSAAGVLLMILIVSIGWLLPIGALLRTCLTQEAFSQAIHVYGDDLVWSGVVCVLSGVCAVAMGVGLSEALRLRGAALILALLFGAMPGAVVGGAMIAAYNRPPLAWIYDHWPILLLAYVARFGWVGMLVACAARTGGRSDIIAQAQLDGAGRGSILGRVEWPMIWPALATAAAVVTALCLADIAASSMVRVPAYSPIAHVLMEKFHRFEDGMLASLSLWLVVSVVPAGLLAGLVLRCRSTG